MPTFLNENWRTDDSINDSTIPIKRGFSKYGMEKMSGWDGFDDDRFREIIRASEIF